MVKNLFAWPETSPCIFLSSRSKYFHALRNLFPWRLCESSSRCLGISALRFNFIYKTGRLKKTEQTSHLQVITIHFTINTDWVTVEWHLACTCIRNWSDPKCSWKPSPDDEHKPLSSRCPSWPASLHLWAHSSPFGPRCGWRILATGCPCDQPWHSHCLELLGHSQRCCLFLAK